MGDKTVVVEIVRTEINEYGAIEAYEILRSYQQINPCSSDMQIIDFMKECGISFREVTGCEMHDRDDQDHFADSKKTDDPEEVKQFIKSLDGEWSIHAEYHGGEITIDKFLTSIDVTFSPELEENLGLLFSKIEENCCYEEIERQECIRTLERGYV